MKTLLSVAALAASLLTAMPATGKTFQTYRHAGQCIQPHHRPSLWQPACAPLHRHHPQRLPGPSAGHYPFTHHRASPAGPLSPSAPCRPAWS